VYDKDDREIAETDANGNTTTFTLDGVGNQIAVTDANNAVTSYEYDRMNRLTTVTTPISGDVTVYGYSGGNQISVTDGLGHTTTTLYDALNRATTIITAVSGGTTVIAYDAAGREISLTDPDGNKTQWAYDADDRVTTETLPNSATVTYVYDNDGELTDTTDADGRRTTYSYDSGGNQTGETWVGSSPAEKITYTYDADHELTGADDAYATLTFTYDSGGNLITSATSGPGTGQPTVTLTSGYDALHSLTSVTDNISGNIGTTTYSYDLGQRLTTITTSYGGTAGPQVVTSYAPNDQISAQSRTIGGSGTAVNTSYSYDSDDRQTTITDYVSGGAAVATYVYSYDSANRVTTMVDAEGTYTYTYDNANELTGVDKGGTQVESYAYDANGNRTGTGYSTTVMNETLTSPGVTYTYDAAGNMISANSGGTITTYTYDYHNRLTDVEKGGTIIATYVYNALNQCIGIDDNGTQTWTIYNGKSPDALPYADFSGSGTLLTRYVSGPGMVNGAVAPILVARTSSGGTTAWYLTDKLDSVRDVVSSSGSELDHIVYDSFGNITTETNASNGDRFKFAAMELDPVVGQYFDRARFYNPVLGRFITRDPLAFQAGDRNIYRYVGNGATNAIDPTGEVANIGVGIGVGVGGLLIAGWYGWYYNDWAGAGTIAASSVLLAGGIMALNPALIGAGIGGGVGTMRDGPLGGLVGMTDGALIASGNLRLALIGISGAAGLIGGGWRGGVAGTVAGAFSTAFPHVIAEEGAALAAMMVARSGVGGLVNGMVSQGLAGMIDGTPFNPVLLGIQTLLSVGMGVVGGKMLGPTAERLFSGTNQVMGPTEAAAVASGSLEQIATPLLNLLAPLLPNPLMLISPAMPPLLLDGSSTVSPGAYSSLTLTAAQSDTYSSLLPDSLAASNAPPEANLPDAPLYP
jgi:RHS repeat-associated protein